MFSDENSGNKRQSFDICFFFFVRDWNESDASDSDHSSEGEDDSDDNIKLKTPETSAAEATANYKKSTYVLIDAKDVLNITITPAFMKILNEIFTIYSNKTLSIVTNKKSINLINDIGPHTKVAIYENKNTESIDDAILVCSKTYENQESCPNSPTKSVYYSSDYNEDEKDSFTDEVSKTDIEMGYDFESTSSLQFPTHSTPILYEKINKHHLKIHIPDFQTLQTSCPKKAWQKLMRLHTITGNKVYYVVAKHTIGKCGRTVVVNSPLQVKHFDSKI